MVSQNEGVRERFARCIIVFSAASSPTERPIISLTQSKRGKESHSHASNGNQIQHVNIKQIDKRTHF
jgi:hypothetical protein